MFSFKFNLFKLENDVDLYFLSIKWIWRLKFDVMTLYWCSQMCESHNVDKYICPRFFGYCTNLNNHLPSLCPKFFKDNFF